MFYGEFNQSIKAIHNTSGTSHGMRRKWECSNKSKNPIRANMMEKQIAELNTKNKLLYFKLNQTDEIVEKREWQSLEHHQSSIRNIASALDTLKSAVEEEKFTKGESEDEIKTWSEEFEKHLEKANQATTRVQSEIQVIDIEEQ